jgi:hypothetical protein
MQASRSRDDIVPRPVLWRSRADTRFKTGSKREHARIRNVG